MLRWYPRSWRARYGEEFTELLIADLADRPRCRRRTADLARCGLLARLAAAGLAGHSPDPDVARQASLAAFACSVAAFLTFGATVWAQLTVSWRWAPPGSPPTAVAMAVMSGAMLMFAALAVAAVIPLAWAALRAIGHGRARPLLRPALMIAGSVLLLLIGGRHFGNGWPGTGGHWWPHQGLVPGGVAAFAWACTLSITSYWAHPAALASFPAAEVVWMVVSPAAVLVLAAGTAQLVRRIECSPRAGRFEQCLGNAAEATMAAFLAGALCWVAGGVAEPRGLFHAGLIDVAALAVMAIALATGGWALHLAQLAGPGRAARP